MKRKKLTPDITGLSRSIWVDENQTHISGGHANRIKVQRFKDEHFNSRNGVSVSVSDDPKLESDISKSDLSISELNQIKRFIIANKNAINKLDRKEIDFQEFKRMIVKSN